jgi:hypothetical protein
LSETREFTADFARRVHEEVHEKAQETTPFRSELECFAESVTELLEDSGVVEQSEVCIREGRVGRLGWEVAGWAFPTCEDEDLTELSILAVLFNDSPDLPPVSADDLRRRFELAINFVEASIRGRDTGIQDSDDAAAFGQLIRKRAPVLRRIVVNLATDGLTQRLKHIEPERIGSIEVTCAIWDMERLSRLADPKQEEIEIDVLSIMEGRGMACLRIPEEDPAYDAYLCAVPGALLYHAYEQYSQRLLELNVRAFLSAAGKVNKGIRDTIRDEPDRFFAYNNGLALTARHVELRQNDAGQDEITRIVGLQIVNGGQTTASIHRAWKLDGAEAQVRRLFVQGKLTVITTVEDDDAGFVDLVRSISRYANSQNAVKGDDLEANQPWHVAFEKLSRSVWTPDAESQWYYERSRGSYATAKARAATTRQRKLEFERQWPRTQLVTKTDLAKAINVWQQRPEIVSLGGQKNFQQFMDALAEQARRPTLEENEFRRTMARVIVYRDAARTVNELKARVPAFRNNVVAYLVAYVSFRTSGTLDFDRIWERQRIPVALKDWMREIAEPIYHQILKSADGRNPSEWCKKSGCWASVQALNLPMPDSVGTTWSKRAATTIDAEDAATISECLRLSIDDWQLLFDWCLNTPSVKAHEREAVSSLRRCALQHWPSPPVLRDARHARRLIRNWRRAVGEDASSAG